MNMEAKSLKIYDISDVSPAETKDGDDSSTFERQRRPELAKGQPANRN